MWDEITYPLSNFNGATVKVWEWINTFIPHLSGHVITYLLTLKGFKLINVSKRGSCCATMGFNLQNKLVNIFGLANIICYQDAFSN